MTMKAKLVIQIKIEINLVLLDTYIISSLVIMLHQETRWQYWISWWGFFHRWPNNPSVLIHQVVLPWSRGQLWPWLQWSPFQWPWWSTKTSWSQFHLIRVLYVFRDHRLPIMWLMREYVSVLDESFLFLPHLVEFSLLFNHHGLAL